MAATDTSTYSTWSADTHTAAGTSWGSVGGDCTTATRDTSYSFKGEQPVPRKHKDKNGCIKKSYWETQPIELGNYGFAGISDLSAFTISTSSVACGTMGATDDTANVCLSTAST